MADNKGPAKKTTNKYAKSETYKLEGDKAVRQNKSCPKCGAGVFLAKHKDRWACGKCSYTEWLKGGN